MYYKSSITNMIGGWIGLLCFVRWKHNALSNYAGVQLPGGNRAQQGPIAPIYGWWCERRVAVCREAPGEHAHHCWPDRGLQLAWAIVLQHYWGNEQQDHQVVILSDDIPHMHLLLPDILYQLFLRGEEFGLSRLHYRRVLQFGHVHVNINIMEIIV